MTEPRRKKNAPPIRAAKQDYPASESIGLLMRIALFGLRASFKAKLAKHGVPWSAWYYLRVLWETDGITQRELTERVGVMQPNTVSALQTMRRADWVTIARSDKDRRQILVTLTPKGRKLMQRLLPKSAPRCDRPCSTISRRARRKSSAACSTRSAITSGRTRPLECLPRASALLTSDKMSSARAPSPQPSPRWGEGGTRREALGG